jgi:hypothetical protein
MHALEKPLVTPGRKVFCRSRQFLRTMRPLLGNRAEISDESVSKWYKYNTFHIN